nr:hypothetical protein Iba_chr06dCG9300 [Ipomoea batatas]
MTCLNNIDRESRGLVERPIPHPLEEEAPLVEAVSLVARTGDCGWVGVSSINVDSRGRMTGGSCSGVTNSGCINSDYGGGVDDAVLATLVPEVEVVVVGLNGDLGCE